MPTWACRSHTVDMLASTSATTIETVRKATVMARAHLLSPVEPPQLSLASCMRLNDQSVVHRPRNSGCKKLSSRTCGFHFQPFQTHGRCETSGNCFSHVLLEPQSRIRDDAQDLGFQFRLDHVSLDRERYTTGTVDDTGKVHDDRLVALKCLPYQCTIDDGLNTFSVVFRRRTCDPG
ncbi:uncharacterized protein FPRO_16133 [Fusarium proliferatum ET1]|uniref:Uncharacterized protein n=2 Tax=Fusarium fujikuroi species complex TaxID=171627 RepID=A0A1L7WBH0_FUSPR|nr:uncharacterized protein FPRO_16133 [Fusarium proliferatum ET1]XP_041691450.1 uncharacterized protein FMAN_15418 [Fusarium mangiferae]CVL09077.1 uncharacterized protein FMAN_15418 [Fusarium mangiferae]CZR49928.1 uncharacterized protein FPRO_16133 [Fusarium proliferatum ET1]